ncbi:MAG: ABC transporter ATP-binding protein [Candidatus Marinimicrobia bacterium]|nr:ABC transporter ATP-binding protein [Candidatus Neomarinimicrobiota bacterium]
MRLYNIRLPHFRSSAGFPDLHIPASRCILLLGDSGSGKSSLLKLLAGFSEPVGGTIEDEGKRSAILLQNPFHQIIMHTVHDELYFPRINAGSGGDEAETAVNEIAKILDIRHLLEREIAELSFGEIQLVMLAATFLTDAEVILLDEPTSHLDREGVRACYRCVALMAERGKSILVASQNPDEYPFFDLVWIVHNGELHACLSAEDFAEKYEEYGIIPDSIPIRERLNELAEKTV